MNPTAETTMIKLTRLNGHPIAINPDLVKFADSTPDTTLTLVTGERLIVMEALDVVVAEVTKWRAHVLRVAWPDNSHAAQASAGQTPHTPEAPHPHSALHTLDHDS